ncbi:Tetraspanin-11 [Trichinella papuae]|uniref:Tetraspanin-11 n=1 Tax=Trichinella papuae TaxID=268474 RepID=A0A0V1NA36_9BILA|nr:Tetraspanin-11 [Trichinella papuae]
MNRRQGFRSDEALLHFFNILLLVIGVAAMITSLSTYNENIQKALANVLNQPDTPINMNYVYYYVNNAISIGAVLATCGVLGFFGVCCRNKCLLNMYLICISVAFAYSMIAFFFFLTERAKLESSIMVVFQKQVLDKYRAGSAELDELVDATHIMFQCCGANGCADFEEPPSSCNCIKENIDVGCMKAVGEFVSIVLNSTFVGGMVLLCLEMSIWALTCIFYQND